MSPRRIALILLLVVIALLGWLLWPAGSPVVRTPESKANAVAVRPPAVDQRARLAAPTPATPESMAADFPVVAQLNAVSSTIARDLDVIERVLDSWRTNFPREGNPVGDNQEITAALTGRNRLGLVLIPKNHPAINAQGELCDRWGTPIFFHQLSGDKMELKSAGPDRKFGTADDALWSPESR
jgi:hypothetical protein